MNQLVLFEEDINQGYKLLLHRSITDELNNGGMKEANRAIRAKRILDYKEAISQLQHELTNVEDELSSIQGILSASSDPILITDPSIKVVYVNPA